MLNTDSDTETTNFTSTDTTSTYDKKTAMAISRRARQEIKHQILENAVQYTMDVFWKDKLIDAARGRFPKGFYYQEGCIVFNKNNKERRILLSVNPLETAKQFIHFLQEAGIYSDRDIEFAKLDASMRSDSHVKKPLVWTKVSKRMKLSMLRTYAKTMSQQWNLTPEASKDFQTILEIGFRIKAINKNNIEFDGGVITNISDVYMDSASGKFFIDPIALEAAIAAEEKERMKNSHIKIDLSQYPNPVFEPIGVDFSGEWNNYIKNFQKNFPAMASQLAEEKRKKEIADTIEVEF